MTMSLQWLPTILKKNKGQDNYINQEQSVPLSSQ